VSGRGNVYMTEIAEQLVQAIAGGGRRAALVVDGVPLDDGRLHLIVAPHEFFPLHPETDEAALADAAAASVCINTEQPGSPWFDLAAAWCRQSDATFDISDHGVAALRERGLDARRLRLGYSASRDRWAGVETDRDVDLVFLGDDSERRRTLLNRGAPLLWEHRCELRMFRSDRPVRPGQPGFLAASNRVDLLARSRVLINVHRGQQPYFEWVRLLDAIANGCLVVSEPSTDTAPLQPFVHLIEAPLETLIEYAVAILHDEPRRRRMARDAYDLVRDRLDDSALIDDALRPFVGPSPGPRASSSKHSPLAPRITAPSPQATAPEVSVVVPVLDDAGSLGAQLDAVLGSEGVDVDVVVVDACADGEARDVVARVQRAQPWAPLRLVTLAGTPSSAAAKNIGFEHARADDVLVMPPGTVVYPNAIASLHSALHRSGAAFSYGLVARGGDGIEIDGALAWEPARLVGSNDVGALALVRRTHWMDMGAYTDSASPGFDDWEMWLRTAAAGARGEQVAAFVGAMS
jgi:hypothetical protein